MAEVTKGVDTFHRHKESSMHRYKIISKVRVLGYVEASNEQEAVDKYNKKECQYSPCMLEATANPIMAVLDSNMAPILKAYREGNKFTRQEAADTLGMTRMTLYRLEKRKHKPSRATLQHLKEAGII